MLVKGGLEAAEERLQQLVQVRPSDGVVEGSLHVGADAEALASEHEAEGILGAHIFPFAVVTSGSTSPRSLRNRRGTSAVGVVCLLSFITAARLSR